MLTVQIRTESHYTINRQRVRAHITDLLKRSGVKTSVEISISIIGDRLMRRLNRNYRKVDDTTDVLSFPLAVNNTDGKFVDPPDNKLHLGDIVISYPQARDEAAEEEKMMDDKIDELVEHGLMHLLGNHHE